MNKLYIKAPIVLGAICVVSAGLLGGVNLLAKTFAPAPSGDAPEAISGEGRCSRQFSYSSAGTPSTFTT